MKAIIFILFLVCALSSPAQKVQQAIETLYKKYPQEKVVLSFSKNDYVAGETIYFKAYVLTGYEPTEVSANLYTELYDKNKKAIRQQIVPLLNGSGQGSFVLPVSLEENVYYVRAYTQLMLNYNEAFQYIKPVNIYNPYSAKILTPKPVQWTASAFAEGGSILNDVPAKLAVRLFSTGSLPQSFKGSLLEKGSNTSVAEIEPLNDEVGMVNFIPQAGKEYVLSIKDNVGKMQQVDIPKNSDSGSALHLRLSNDKIEYSIYSKNIASNGAGYKLAATIHDQLVYLGTVKKSAGIVKGTIEIKNLPAGVLRLTLFDEAENPVNERLCFIHQQVEPTGVELKNDTISFAPKGYNHWQMALDSFGWPSYSVQVSDAAYPIENSFLSDLYLTSDFTTPVHKAPAYFQQVDETKKAALDALLITEKWERFHWEDVLNNRFPKLDFYPDLYLSYTGTVRKGKNPQPLKDVNLILKGKDSSFQFMQVKTDNTGSFKLNDIMFTDTIQVYYQANNRKFLERDVEVDFEAMNKFYPYKKAFPSSAFEVTVRSNSDTVPAHIKWIVAQRSNELLLSEKSNMMKEVVIRTRAKNATEELDKKLSSGLFSSMNETIFDFVNEDHLAAQSYSNILKWLQGRVAGFSVGMQDGVLVPYLRGGAATQSPAQVFLDEMPVDADVLNGISANNIAMIKVINGSFVGGRGGGANGAIIIYTRRGGMESKSSTPSLNNSILVGYQRQPQFLQPDYTQEILKNTADQRAVLFLSHLVYPNQATLQTPIIFYNNDRAISYRLVVTGFASDGSLIYTDKLISGQ
ncbi:MAG: hypothetical protein JWR72_3630 [Flavisolibacter sp.]|jgi:hypothetical protein|nr:hypothetical protein [Flavisolibacter sp.]